MLSHKPQFESEKIVSSPYFESKNWDELELLSYFFVQLPMISRLMSIHNENH